jgi:outer membrane protein assembly factor BamB
VLLAAGVVSSCGTSARLETAQPRVEDPGDERPAPGPIRIAATDPAEAAAAERPPQPGSAIWARRFGGSGSDMGVAVTLDSSDNIYVLGQFTGELDLGTGGIHPSYGLDDIFLLKLDPTGEPIWSRSFGGTSHDYADDIAVDAQGNIYIAGSFMERLDLGGGPLKCKGVHDVFVAKLDSNGEHLWSKAYGDAQDQICLRVAVDASGGVFLAGYFRGEVKLGRKRFRSYPDKAAFVGKLDDDGQHVWSEQYGHIFDYAFPGLVQAPNGELIHIGGSDPTKEFTGKKLKRKPRMMDLGVVLARYRPDGERIWRHRFGRGSDNLNTFVDLDPAGNIVIGGSYAGIVDFGGDQVLEAGTMAEVFVAELDPAGAHRWSHSFGGTRYQYLAGLAVDDAGNVFLTGQHDEGSIDLGGEPLDVGTAGGGFVAKLDDEGQHVWSNGFGSAQIQFPGDLALDSGGRPVIIGSFNGVLELGGAELVSAGFHDVFVVVLHP